MGMAVGSLDLEDTLLNGKQGNIESTTTKIEDQDVSLLLLLSVETVSNSSGGGLVDDSEDVDSGDGSSILGGLSLGVVEVGGHGDNSGLDGFSEVVFGDFLHLLQDHGRNLLSLELLFLTLVGDDDDGLVIGSRFDLEWPELDVFLDGLVGELSADESLSVEDGVGGVSGSLVLGSITDESLIFGECNVGGGGVKTLVVGNDLNLVVHPDSDAGVGGSKVDSDSGFCGHV